MINNPKIGKREEMNKEFTNSYVNILNLLKARPDVEGTPQMKCVRRCPHPDEDAPAIYYSMEGLSAAMRAGQPTFMDLHQAALELKLASPFALFQKRRSSLVLIA